MSLGTPDPYAALGVSRDADIATIRSAHRKLVLRCHPDRIQDVNLKEQGKEAFQRIQQAYELLTDPAKKSRYDDEVKLAALRREAMARDGPTTRSQTYSGRPAAPREPPSRHRSYEDGVYYEERRPRNDEYTSSRERFEEPDRTSSRKYGEYERHATPKKPVEKDRPAKTRAASAWTRAAGVVNAGLAMKKEADKSRATKEAKERERRKERSEKAKPRHAYVDSDSDSDNATHVTESTVKASPRPTPRHSPQSSRSSRPSPGVRKPTYTDEDSDDSGTTAKKWESYHDKTKQYIEKAAAGAGTRPKFERHESGSYWTSHMRGGSDPDRHSTVGADRERRSYDETRRPSMPTQNSAPGNLRAKVEERVPKERRSAGSASYTRERESDHRKEMPAFHRSQTMPVPSRSSRKDAAPNKSSNLKHAETHDSGYGSSSTPHTPDPREDSPVRRTQSSRNNTSTRYQIVDPDSEDDTRSRVHRMDDSKPRSRRVASPEPISDPRRRPERPRLDIPIRAKSSREYPGEQPKMRRSESSRHYDDRDRSGRDSNTSSRYNSKEKLFAEVDDYDDTPSPRTKEKGGPRSPYTESNIGYGEKHRDYIPGSRFYADARGGASRRPSMQA